MTNENQAEDNKVSLPSSMETAAAAIASRCHEDPDFAKRLRADPKAVLEEMGGNKLPESLVIKVHENDGRTWHLPVPQGDATDKLSDDQLKSISGGWEVWIMALVISLTAVTIAAPVATGVGVAAAGAAGTRL